MRDRSRAVVAIIALLFCAEAAPSQSKDSAKEPTGSISGRITMAGKPAPSVTVLLLEANVWGRPPAAEVTTDEQGHYRLGGLAAGQYVVSPAAPGYSAPRDWPDLGLPGKLVTVGDGETVEGVDLTLTRGGVITGRVTDSDGRPVVGESVDLMAVREGGKRERVRMMNSYMFTTDDRGVYRIYGLPAGRYVASVGEDVAGGGSRHFARGAWYARTFHPSVADESQAAVIEVTAGGEARNVDIVVGRPARSHRASGRVVDAESGRPVAGVPVAYAPVRESSGRVMVAGGRHTDAHTNVSGEFQLSGVIPGRYALTLGRSAEEGQWFAEPVPFAVTDRDVDGLELKLHRGGSISGVAAIEGTEDPAVLGRLSELTLGFYVRPAETDGIQETGGGVAARVQADGSFRVAGLRPGKVFPALQTWRGPKGFSVLRVERDGAEVRGPFEIAPGEQVTGLRIVVAYGTGGIRGRIQVDGGEPPGDMQFGVSARRVGSEIGGHHTDVDALRKFTFDGLPAGEYEVEVHAWVPRQGASAPKPRTAKKMVSVTDGTTSEVVVALDLNAPEEGQEP